MTETIEKMRIGGWLEFLAALILAPLVVLLVSVIEHDLMLISTFAILYGGGFYLVLGGPMFYWLTRSTNNPLLAALTGFAANLGTPVAILFFNGLTGYGFRLGDIGMAIFLFGCAYSAVWGLTFGLLHRWFAGRGAAA